jgi:hypothetical protein
MEYRKRYFPYQVKKVIIRTKKKHIGGGFVSNEYGAQLCLVAVIKWRELGIGVNTSIGLHDEPAGTMIQMTIVTVAEFLVRLIRHSLTSRNCLEKLA